MGKPKVLIKNIHKDFYYENEFMKVLDNINIELFDGEFISIIGPSGCGKSTIFHLMTKIEDDFKGHIEIDGIELKDYKKRISYMSQKDLLMPWRSLIDNVMLPLELQNKNKDDAKKSIREMLPIFGLEGFENAYPSELSGGMRQRAALLRTVLVESEIMLLDEPFGALDAISRSNMQQWLLEIWTRYKKSVLFITHDIEEAIFLSDRIYVLSPRPAVVIKEIKIDFERPRNKKIVVSDKFLAYKKILIDALG